jgi:hypothetical protein
MSTDVLAMLDLLTALAGVGAGVAAVYPAKTTRSRLAMGDDDCMPSLPGWTRRVRTLAFVLATSVWRVRVCRVGVDHATDVRVASR